MSLPRLYHAPSSYYSMIARLALTEAGVAFEPQMLDIHRRKQHLAPAYARVNPNLTVPALDLGDRVLDDSRLILLHVFGKTDETLDAETRRLVDLQYSFPVEDLTFGLLLAKSNLFGKFARRTLTTIGDRLNKLAEDNPDLADVYTRRAEVFAGRLRTFDPAGVVAMLDARRSTAFALLDKLDALLSDGRATLVPSGYGPADVVWTVFLARMHFLHFDDEIARRPALARYDAAMAARPSFHAADVWAKASVAGMLKQMWG